MLRCRALGLLVHFQLGADGSGADEVGVEGGLLGVYRGLREVIDDATMNALFDPGAKLFLAESLSVVAIMNP